MQNNLNTQFTGQDINSPRTQSQQKGTGFTNLNQYLQANQGNQLGNTLVNGINQDVGNVNQGLQQSQNQFNQGVENVNNQTNTYQNQANDTFNRLDTGYQNLNNQVQASPSSPDYNAQNYANYNLGVTQPDYQNFADIRGYQYNGPTQLNNIYGLQQQAQQTQQLGDLTSNNAGRAALLSRYVNNPQYNSYQQNLDALYLQNSNPQLQQARRATLGLYNNTVGAEQNAENQAQAAQGAITGLQNNVQSGLDTRQSNELSNLTNLANQYGTNQSNAVNQLSSDFANNKLTDQEAALTGINHGTRIFNLGSTVGNYVSPEFNPSQQNVGNVADRAQLNALAKLAGNTQSAFDLSAPQYDPSKPYTFNNNGFTQALTDANNQYNTAYNSAANPFLYNGKNGIDAQQYQPGSGLSPQQYGFTDKTAAQQLQDLLATANPQGIVTQGNFTYDVNNAMQGLKTLLSGIQSQQGYNNVLQ